LNALFVEGASFLGDVSDPVQGAVLEELARLVGPAPLHEAVALAQRTHAPAQVEVGPHRPALGELPLEVLAVLHAEDGSELTQRVDHTRGIGENSLIDYGVACAIRKQD